MNLEFLTVNERLILTFVIFFFLVKELSDAEKMMIIHSEDFQQFMDRAGRVMERALSENVDIYTDYTGALDDNDVKLVII